MENIQGEITKNLFIVAGAQRSGTTFLYHILDQNSDIYMAKPLQPEPKFFCDPSLYQFGSQYYFDKYFKVEREYMAYGEKSTSYMTVAGTPQRIYEMFPEVKLIFLLRNPIERAISNYWFSIKNKLETCSFEYAVLNEKRRISEDPMPDLLNHPFAYLARGRYFIYVKEYLKYFAMEQILFLKTEDLFINTLAQIRKINAFLGVNPGFIPDLSNIKMNTAERKQNVLTLELKEYLTQYFKQDNQELEALLNMDLSDWSVL